MGARGALSDKAITYTKLELDAEFAAKRWGSAMASLETTRAQAERKQIYLERLVEPNTPDQAMEPKRLRGILTVFLSGLLLWAILSLLIESLKEHKD